MIDPGLAYSTFLGGALYDDGLGGIAVDREGNAYVAGRTDSADFPITLGAFDATHNGSRDVFVTKLNAAGSELLYSTFIGGTNFDEGLGVAVDRQGNTFVTGSTGSTDFPTTPGAYDRTHNGHGEVFVLKLNAGGSALDYSTFIGGAEDSEFGLGIAVRRGEAYVTGATSSDDSPTTEGAFDTIYGEDGDGFVVKLNAAGSALAYSTYLGGTGYDDARGIAVDDFGNAFLTGRTNSVDFPTTPGAFDTILGDGESGGLDGYVTRLNWAGSALDYSTFLGGRLTESGEAVALDMEGRAYVTGDTYSGDFPTTPGAFDRTFNNATTTEPLWDDIFVTKVTHSGSGLVYSTFIGGTHVDFSFAIAVSSTGNSYVTGRTHSADFPTTADAFDRTYGGDGDVFVTRLNANGSALRYSTFLGGSLTDTGMGIAPDPRGNAYVTGDTESADFPTTEGAFDRTHNGGDDGFVTKLPT